MIPKPAWTSLLIGMLLVAGGCTGTRAPSDAEQDDDASDDVVLERFRTLSGQSPEEAARYLLDSAARALDNGETEAARRYLQRFGETGVSSTALQRRHSILQAQRYLAENRPARAMSVLPAAADQPDPARRRILSLRARAHYQQEQYLAAARDRVEMQPLLDDESERAANNNRIWQILTSAPPGRLVEAGVSIDSYELRGWLDLLNTTHGRDHNMQEQFAAIERWQERWNEHSAASRLPDSLSALVTIWENRPREIDLLLPLQEPAGNAIHQGFMSAYYQALASEQSVPTIRVHDTSGTSDIRPIYQEAVEDGTDLIIGPLNKASVRQLQNRSELPVTTLALNYGEQPISPAGLYQFGLAPEDEIRRLTDLAWQSNHRNAAVITPAGSDYERLQNIFVSQWQELGGETVARASFSGSDSYSSMVTTMMHINASESRAERIRDLLPRDTVHFTPRRRRDIDFLFLAADPSQGRQINGRLDFHYAGDVPVYALPSIYDGGADTVANRDLSGVRFVDAPWMLVDEFGLKETVARTWPQASGAVQRLRAMGADSFRLYTRLQQLADYPQTRIPGATGVLFMRSDGSIGRRLMAAQFVDGVARPLERE